MKFYRKYGFPSPNRKLKIEKSRFGSMYTKFLLSSRLSGYAMHESSMEVLKMVSIV